MRVATSWSCGTAAAAQREELRPHPAGQLKGVAESWGCGCWPGARRAGPRSPSGAAPPSATTRRPPRGRQEGPGGLSRGRGPGGGLGASPSPAFPGFGRLTPGAAAGCGFPGARLGPGSPRASCAATGPLPSVTASPHPALAGSSSAGLPLPLPRAQQGHHPQNSALVWGPELLLRLPSSDSFSPGSQQAGGADVRWGMDVSGTSGGHPVSPPVQRCLLPRSEHQVPPALPV